MVINKNVKRVYGHVRKFVMLSISFRIIGWAFYKKLICKQMG